MTGQQPRLGTGCFDVQLPTSELATKPTRARIAKSVVRSRATDLPSSKSSIEYVSSVAWKWNECEDHAVYESPFEKSVPADATSCSIFSSKDCLMPFSETNPPESDTVSKDADSATDGLSGYRPSSPFSDMSD